MSRKASCLYETQKTFSPVTPLPQFHIWTRQIAVCCVQLWVADVDEQANTQTSKQQSSIHGSNSDAAALCLPASDTPNVCHSLSTPVNWVCAVPWATYPSQPHQPHCDSRVRMKPSMLAGKRQQHCTCTTHHAVALQASPCLCRACPQHSHTTPPPPGPLATAWCC